MINADQRMVKFRNCSSTFNLRRRKARGGNANSTILRSVLPESRPLTEPAKVDRSFALELLDLLETINIL